jgi:hypothetical protein
MWLKEFGIVTTGSSRSAILRESEGKREVNRFKRAMRTGTDRNKRSTFWNADGHDFENDRHPSGKRPDERIYAFTLDLDHTPYKVLHRSGI